MAVAVSGSSSSAVVAPDPGGALGSAGVPHREEPDHDKDPLLPMTRVQTACPVLTLLPAPPGQQLFPVPRWHQLLLLPFPPQLQEP